MTVTIKLRYLRHSAKKLRPYLRIFKGKSLEASINETSLMNQDSARFLHKALLMARAAASQKEYALESLMVAEVMASEGPKIKRNRPNARGRSNRYEKHLSHLTVSVAPREGSTKIDQTKPAAAPAKPTTTVRKRGQ